MNWNGDLDTLDTARSGNEEMKPTTTGLNHLGLTVANLDNSVAFFVDCLGWEESGPRR